MADNSILTPGFCDSKVTPTAEPAPDKYLTIDNYLSEYDTEDKKSVVRENLNVPSKENVYSKDDVDAQVAQRIKAAIQEYLNLDDPYGIIPQVEQMIADMVKTDGSTPFTLPQTGVDPQTDYHLTTKKYVDRLMKDHLNSEDPHGILAQVADLLVKYAKSSDVYTKSLVYNKQEIDSQSKSYVKRDGTTPFLKPQIGADPTIDSHLATKRYIDKAIYNHIVDIDPHGFTTILNQRLAYYIKKKDVFDKTQTYSRTQIDSIINKSVNDVVDASIQEFMDSVNDKLEYIRQQKYVKQDGSVPFTAPQVGIEATNDNELVTLSQLNALKVAIDEHQPDWITSGPVESTVGKVDEGTEFPPTVSFQEIMDAIFYGQTVSVTVPPYTNITETCEVLVCIHGSLSLVETAELYQGDKLIHTFTKEDFENGCVTIDSEPILEDTTFRFVVNYSKGIVHDDEAITKVSLPVFVGLLPKWKFGNTITMDYLKELETQDTEGTQNRFLNEGSDLESFSFTYKFEDAELRHPFIVMPADYPDLDTMTTSSQKFGIEAFDVINMIPLHVDGVEKDIIFKQYIYKQALSSLNQEVTFNFKKA